MKDGLEIRGMTREEAAAISAVAYDSLFGFMGFYIVAPEFRGKGYGVRIWRAALEAGIRRD